VLRKKLTKGRAEKRQGRQSQKTEKTEEDSLLTAGSILAGSGGGGDGPNHEETPFETRLAR